MVKGGNLLDCLVIGGSTLVWVGWRQGQGQRPNEKKKFPVLPTSIHPCGMVGAASLWPWLWRRSVTRYSAWLFVLHTSRKQRLVFFFFAGFVACFVSLRDLFLLLWFCTNFEEKGPTVCGRFLASFHPRICFCNLTRDECLETKKRWRDGIQTTSPHAVPLSVRFCSPSFCRL